MNSFELVFDVIDDDILIDMEYYQTKEEQCLFLLAFVYCLLVLVYTLCLLSYGLCLLSFEKNENENVCILSAIPPKSS